MLVLFGIKITEQPIQNIRCEEIDRRERSAEFVRYIRNKLFLKARALLPGLFENNANLLPLGHVLHYDRVAQNRAFILRQQGDVYIGPELVLIGTDAPSFAPNTACFQGLLQLFLRHAIMDILGSKEAREVMSHYVDARIAKHPFGSHIPGGYAPN